MRDDFICCHCLPLVLVLNFLSRLSLHNAGLDSQATSDLLGEVIIQLQPGCFVY